MRFFNLFYISVIAVGILLYLMLDPTYNPSEISFYGFAESNETEINYNYPVVIDRIHVTPGQSVKSGEILMHISRRKSKETLSDQQYQIEELRAEEKAWKTKKRNDIKTFEIEKSSKIDEIAARISEARSEWDYLKKLGQGLQSIQSSDSEYSPLEAKINRLENEKSSILRAYDALIEGIESEIKLGSSPYRAQIEKLEAELVFDEDQKIVEIDVTAPSDGLIGTISCKEQEHVPSYSTLLTFYEPHSGLVKGYVHEDLTLQVLLGDKYEVASLKDEHIQYEGKVIGLGSRIVEIPTRLRKVENFKTYGREVLVQISDDNTFLQKEKVSLRYLGKDQ